MRLVQLPSQARVAGSDRGEREEAILEVARQQCTVLQVLDRLSLGVQDSLYPLDDLIAMDQEELEQFDVCLKQ
jgi:hypothetical protein